MTSHEKDKVPMSSDRHPRSVPENADSQSQAFTSSDRSESFSIPVNYMESHKNESNLVGFTGPLRAQRRTPELQMTGPLYIDRKGLAPFGENQSVAGRQKVELKAEKFSSLKGIDQNDCKDDTYGRNEHLLRSGQLGMCNDPYCTICPTNYHPKAAQHTRASSIFDPKLHSVLYGDAKGWAKRFVSFLKPYIPGVMSPHAKVVKHWNQFFVISCSLAIFIDPLFFFLLSVQKNNKCIVIDGHMTTVMVVLRSITDIVYLLNMLLQFRLAYVAPESTMVRTRESVNNPLQFAPEYIEVTAGELVDIPRKIAMNYLRGYFVIDLLLVIPLPQIIILFVLPDHLGSSGANYAKNLLRAAVLAQYIPRLYRFSPLLIGHSPSGFIFETAWANFFVNLLTVMLSAHIVGSCWYLFGLQRVNECLREACHNTDMKGDCMSFIDCGHGDVGDTASNPLRDSWKKNTGADACFTTSGFSHGIYAQAAALTLEPVITRYVYSLFWGFQQISTLAGNQIPSYFVWEVIFTMGIIGLGLLLFAFLIGNMQNFLQALGRRRLEMSLRRRDVDQWMEHRRLPQQLRRKVLEAERYNWAATRGVNEGLLLESLPEDLQRDIRRHRFKFAKQVWIFALMDDYILDAICARLRQTIYIKGGVIFYQGGAVEHMVFIVRGKLESIGEDGNIFPLSEGNVCGEELVTWCLEHSSVGEDGKKIRTAGQRLLSSRTVRCLTNVEGFTLRVADIEEVTSLFAKSLQKPRIQGAIRYQSPYWRTVAATQIQVAWRSRRKWLKRSSTSHAKHCSN